MPKVTTKKAFTSRKNLRSTGPRSVWLPLVAGLSVAAIGTATIAGSRAAANITPPATTTTGTRSLLKPAKTYKAYRNLRYSNISPSKNLSLNLYIPQNGAKQIPLIIYVHGGAWVTGSKDQNCVPYDQKFMRYGFAVACISYRLETEAIWPAQIIDLNSSIRSLRANAAKFHIYPDKIGLWGYSSGAQIAAVAGTAGNTPAFEQGSHLDTSSAVQAVVDDAGPTDFMALVKTPGLTASYDLALSPFSMLLGGKVSSQPAAAASASAVTYINGDEPPFLIRHGDKDSFIPLAQSQLLQSSLQKAGDNAQLTVIKGGQHVDDAAFSNPTRLLNVARFFNKYLRP